MPAPMGGASKVGTIDPMGKNRVYTDEFLEEVPAGSPRAAFSWERGELAARKDRRAELGLDKNDDALRAQIDSRKNARAALLRRKVAAEDELAALDAAIAADGKGAKATEKPAEAEAEAEAEDVKAKK